MQKLLLPLMVLGIALPAFAGQRVTVEQLERMLAAAHGKPDVKLSNQLTGLELTERLSAAKLSRWEADSPGPESRQALVALADVSAFLDPPPAEIPATTTPDLATQRQIMAQTVDYAVKTIARLPDFFATRDTIHFEDTPARQLETGYHPLRPVARVSATVLYRDGKEVVDAGRAKDNLPAHAPPALTTSGVFGLILGTVLVDSSHGKLAWSHWEQAAAGPAAVFRFAIPREESHYDVEFCCVPSDRGSSVFKQFTGYHGEIAVDPVTGATLRLTLEADLKPTDPLLRSDILVEYGPVEIGGKTYICPIKSVSISVAPALLSDAFRMQRDRGSVREKDSHTNKEHLQTFLNDVVFEQYHLFRAESRILSGDSAEAEVNQPASSLTTEMSDAGSPAPAVSPMETAPAKSSAPAAAPLTASTPTQPLAPEPAVPEISVTASTGLPEPPSNSQTGSTISSFTLHVTTRLVDVGVVALDKKGHPVTDLKPVDFEIYDNGRKATVRSFSQAGVESAKGSGLTPGQPVFSNRRADTVDAQPEAGVTEGNTTILLIDSGNLAWADLTYARAEMLRFLRSLPSNELVGLYFMNAHSFQVLEEGTADHASVGSKLSQWMPSAQDLARAQELEQRNRSQFDYVLNPGDLQSVNGNIDMAPDTASPVDPQLRENGSNPARNSLSILSGVARHLAANAGHKSLVWVTSDNVLVDWTDRAVSVDLGSKHIDGLILRAQEAMNDAHVSLYPLDASQLETNAIDPSLKNSSIGLSPSVTAPPGLQGGGQTPGRITAEMQQDLHPIQAAFQKMAEATGGQVFRRSDEIAKNLDKVIADGRAAYLLGFTPDTPADGQYHVLTVKLAVRRGVTLRYRTGYEYAKEPATLKERFQQAIWQPLDASQIAVSANPRAASQGATLRVNIATSDLALKQQDERWVDKLDIFLAQRDDQGLHARITGQTLTLTLKAATYEKLLQNGIPFDQFIEKKQDTGSVRIVVVDENSGRMGSVTVPATVLQGKN
jgi:VWFA-related protein